MGQEGTAHIVALGTLLRRTKGSNIPQTSLARRGSYVFCNQLALVNAPKLRGRTYLGHISFVKTLLLYHVAIAKIKPLSPKHNKTIKNLWKTRFFLFPNSIGPLWLGPL